MRCRDIERLSSAYVDGDLDDHRSSAVRGHLRVCQTCRVIVEETVIVRDLAGDLEPIDPPAALWAGIEERLAEAEIADANRPALWLWWRGARQHVLMGAAAVAVAVAFVWGTGYERAEYPLGRMLSRGAAGLAESATVGPSETHEQRVRAQMAATDDYYAGVIEELRALVAEEADTWPPAVLVSYKERLAELEAESLRHRKLLAVNDRPDPRSRDELYAAYEAEITFLQAAALGELPGLDSAW